MVINMPKSVTILIIMISLQTCSLSCSDIVIEPEPIEPKEQEQGIPLSEQIRAIKLGMTMDEVEAELGVPQKTSFRTKSTLDGTDFRDVQVTTWEYKDSELQVTITFEDNKVTSLLAL